MKQKGSGGAKAGSEFNEYDLRKRMEWKRKSQNIRVKNRVQ